MDRTAIATLVLSLLASQALSQRYNPTILQDSRDEPKVDGAFGFLYRTEDGISHTAQGIPGGQINGRYSYTDPTGLKVNINYFAGSQATPGYTYDKAPAAPSNQPQPERRTRPQSSNNFDSYNYNEVNSNGQQYDNGQYDSRQYDNGQYDNNLYENPPYQQPNNQYQPAPYRPPNNQYQPSNNQYQPANNQYQPANNQYQPANNQYQPANNKYSNSRY